MRTLAVLCMVAAAAFPRASVAAGDEAGAWSKPVNGLQARLSFAQKETSNGTPIITAYLELRNVSDRANVMEVPLESRQMEFSVTDTAGKAVAPANGPYDGISVERGVIRLPYDSRRRFNVTQRGAGIPRDQAGLLDLGAGRDWVFKRGDEGAYYLHARLTVKETNGQRWSGTIRVPKARVPVGKKRG